MKIILIFKTYFNMTIDETNSILFIVKLSIKSAVFITKFNFTSFTFYGSKYLIFYRNDWKMNTFLWQQFQNMMVRLQNALKSFAYSHSDSLRLIFSKFVPFRTFYQKKNTS